MIWLICCIISFIGIFLSFKFIKVKNAPLLNCVIVNYLIASILEFFVCDSFSLGEIIHSDWLYVGIFLGVLFIMTFIVLGISSEKSGMGISAVASKMSLVIPMLFSIIFYKEPISGIKISALILAIISVFFCVYKPEKRAEKTNLWKILLPVLLFLGMGINDSLVVYSRQSLGAGNNAALFTATLFAVSLIAGILYSFVGKGIFKNFLNRKVWILGTILGCFNFGSIFFVIMTMNADFISISAIYGICNTITILLSLLIGRIFFKEKLSKLNILGGFLAMLTIILMAIS